MLGILGVVLGSGVGAWLLMWNADRAGRAADKRAAAARANDDAFLSPLAPSASGWDENTGTPVNRGAW